MHLRNAWREQGQAATTESRLMSDHKRFGLWTLAAAIGWIAGLAMAFITIRKLWSDWYH